ncbi:MAG: hypothetical protein NC898_05240 [Candidatus Omnitrophica bacterium]|nr:hypothetical protein [Candidatus Omnitrophota bacterium]
MKKLIKFSLKALAVGVLCLMMFFIGLVFGTYDNYSCSALKEKLDFNEIFKGEGKTVLRKDIWVKVSCLILVEGDTAEMKCYATNSSFDEVSSFCADILDLEDYCDDYCEEYWECEKSDTKKRYYRQTLLEEKGGEVNNHDKVSLRK